MTRHARTVFPIMGTVASIAVAESDWSELGEASIHLALGDARRELERVESVFSHYRADSSISRWIAGEDVAVADVTEIQLILFECARLAELSDGVFSIIHPMTGEIDTAGYVKGYAIDNAVAVMRDHGLSNFAIGVGGDGFYAGRPQHDRPWRVAVSDSRTAGSILAIIDAEDCAVATSGSAERGDHIWALGNKAPEPLASFTVIGPSIAEADAYATIGFAMGSAGMAWVSERRGYRSVMAEVDGSVLADAALVSAV